MPAPALESDHSQRMAALDPARSFIVQAPAGSGKTELLVQRFLKLLALSEHPESVVAITFTRKASGEMRERIAGALRKAADGVDPQSPHEALTLDLASRLLMRDREMQWRLLDNPARLRILTFDALALSITHRMPWLSRFGAGPNVTEDVIELYREAARRTLAHLDSKDENGDAIELLLQHRDNDFAQAEQLLLAMLGRRDQWLRHAVQARRDELERGLRNAVREALAYAVEALPAHLRDRTALLAKFLRSKYPEAADFPKTAASWHAVRDTLFTGSGDWRKRLTEQNGFGPRDPWKQKALDLIEELRRHPTFQEAALALDHLPPEQYSEEQWRLIEALFRVLKLAAAELRLVFRERKSVDFIELSLAANTALGSIGEPSELAYALDHRIQHLLADEFQDTSYGQYLLLERLTAGWTEGDGHTLFAVGDPMQSIYRFREADVGLYLNARKHGLGGLRLNPLVLRWNFRSRAGVVDWVNHCFDRLFPAAEDPVSGAVSYSHSIAVKPALEQPAVESHIFRERDDDGEARLVADLAAEALEHGTVAILVRARGHAVRAAAALRARGIRFQAVEMDSLAASEVVSDLESLTRAMLHPADRVSWFAVLRAPWCGLTLAGLLALSGERTVMEALEDLAGLSPDDAERAGRARAILKDAFAARRLTPLRLWIEETWWKLGGPACARNEADFEAAATFLGLLERHTRGGDLLDFEALRADIEELNAPPDPLADGRIQLMTMHKAKGLEFDTVIAPGLGRKISAEEQRLLLWQERGEDLLIAPIKPTGSDKDAVYKFLSELDRRKSRFEDGRLLYVTATRARQRLHWIGHVGAHGNPAKTSLLAYIWDSIEPRWIGAAPADPAAASRGVPLRRPAAGWRLPAPPEPVRYQADAVMEDDADQRISFDWAGDTLRHVGTVVHSMLRRIARDGVKAWPRQRVASMRQQFGTRLAVLGVPATELESALDRLERALANTLADERGRWLLTPHEEQETEFALTGVDGDRIVNVALDRTFVDNGVRWIVDYKTSLHEGAGVDEFLDNERVRYAGQLERYAKLMRAIDTRPIRLGLYFPLLGGWREWSWGERAMTADRQMSLFE